jgi:hypothetical protein
MTNLDVSIPDAAFGGFRDGDATFRDRGSGCALTFKRAPLADYLQLLARSSRSAPDASSISEVTTRP